VLGWIKGVQPEPDLVYRAFAASCATRRLSKAGYVRFRNYFLYGERHLAGASVLVEIFQEALTLGYHEETLARYAVEWQPGGKQLWRVGNPRLYQHPNHSPQMDLWPPGAVEWCVIIRADPRTRRRRRHGHVVVVQPPLPIEPIEPTG